MPNRPWEILATTVLLLLTGVASPQAASQQTSSASEIDCASPTNPGVNICSPTRGIWTTSPVRVVAAAKGNGGIRYMQIYVRGQKYATYHGTDRLDVNVDMGGRGGDLAVVARDANQSYVQKVFDIKIYGESIGCDTTTNLTVKICSPYDQSAAIPRTFRLVAVAASSAGVKFVQVYVNGAKHATYYTNHLDTTVTVATGGFTRFTVQAKDNVGTVFKETIFITLSE